MMATPSSTTVSSSSATAVAAPPSPTRTQEEARAAVLASLSSAGSFHDSKYLTRASDLHANSSAIAKQESELLKSSKALAKESDKWQKELDKATKGVKEVGDLQNWAEMLEREFCVLEETLRLAEGGEREESASGGSEWRV
ncbi:unnamed protein product [Zymoseptoria tritici ST99CH_1A5]|uniref:Biogenesis of lysosome-related organelles complex 1 subunit 1 n=3 Tax=Zymoseptoria tritici TaxID=1047171 RepID=A0A1X7RH04_ZYMT9|nr:unnamed protein product [Zymoseptoria tritici ST99CH_3D7]SMR45012.1 unnamed protein product [Zymoseptoria tritici ST99CH_3D1]SMY20177.1 unnamed protein product [Zymoseptoria tritici ST99CH_1A5]